MNTDILKIKTNKNCFFCPKFVVLWCTIAFTFFIMLSETEHLATVQCFIKIHYFITYIYLQ